MSPQVKENFDRKNTTSAILLILRALGSIGSLNIVNIVVNSLKHANPDYWSHVAQTMGTICVGIELLLTSAILSDSVRLLEGMSFLWIIGIMLDMLYLGFLASYTGNKSLLVDASG